MFSLPDLAEAVHKYMQDNLPGRTPRRLLIITVEDGTEEPHSIPIVSARIASPATDKYKREDEKEPFAPSPFQKAILDALKGKALHKEALGAKVGDPRRLYRPGGIRELLDHGLVKKHRRLGYYRPDEPPQSLTDPN